LPCRHRLLLQQPAILAWHGCQPIGAGTHLDYISREEKTASSLASDNGHTEIVHLLLERGTPVNQLSMQATPGAIDNPSINYVEHSIGILKAAKKKRVAELLRLIMIGVKVDEIGDDKLPIIWAARSRKNAAVITLIRNDVGENNRDSLGQTVMSYATCQGYVSTIRLLWGEGSKIDHQDNIRRTPLSYEASYRHKEATKILFELGSEKETKDRKSRTHLI